MKYAIVCCGNSPLAILDVRGTSRVEVKTVAHTAHLRVVTNPIINGKATFQADELSRATHEDAAERNVTEIAWGDHRSWIIRCGSDCPTNQQVEINARNLPKLARRLSEGQWQEVIGDTPVVPLGVLNYIMGRLNG